MSDASLRAAVDALRADVYVVTDTVRGGAGVHGRADTSITVERLREIFGARFRGGEVLSAAAVANVSSDAAWAEIVEAQVG